MLELVKTIKGALSADIDAADWMSAETKKKAHVKLEAQVDKIAYPDHWQNYSSVEIKRDDFLGNVQRSSRFELQRRLGQFGKPVDRLRWNMLQCLNERTFQARVRVFPNGFCRLKRSDATASV